MDFKRHPGSSLLIWSAPTCPEHYPQFSRPNSPIPLGFRETALRIVGNAQDWSVRSTSFCLRPVHIPKLWAAGEAGAPTVPVRSSLQRHGLPNAGSQSTCSTR